MKDYEKIFPRVKRIVKEAGKRILQTDFTVAEKTSPADLVTSADLSVQTYLQSALAPLLPAGFYCEEKDVRDKTDGYLWIIDPIDGTANFVHGIPDCAVSVALTKGDEVLLGVVYNPFKKELYAAKKGEGATLNGKPIHTSSRPFSACLFCTALCVYRKEYAARCASVIADVFPLCADVRRFGGCAEELCYLAAGKCDLYFEIRVLPWDYAAGYLILSEAGGVIRDLYGNAPRLDRPTVLVGANTKENYETLAKTVSRHIKEQVD